MNATHKKLDDGTIEITVTIPWTSVRQAYEGLVEEKVKEAELPGFRKGKAPKNLVEEKLDTAKLYEDVIRTLLPKLYNEAITELKIRPIVNPKIEFKEALEGKDWTILVRTAEKPELLLGEYKKAIAELNAAKRTKIWTPDQTAPPDKPKKDEAPTKPTLEELLSTLFTTVTAKIPGILVEHEVNRLLSDLVDQVKKLGLSVEQYLASTNRTAESIRHEYETQAERSITLEFALEEIADKEGILVSDDDIDAVIKTAKSDEERATLSKERYYLASVLRRQKTLDFLASL
ncbi:MAG: trigger factor [bacterium]|nr:trigger factor [bacterium]